ncbi:Ig-like domain-containing protein [Pseudomonas sp. NPDC087612]|uniref:Ig-like domain-containing protein n=1 Tax=unclassified Pseudomonas TaxID=196821 RepID=UPI0005EB8D1E|nr:MULTISPECIES: Ig-like domain-containing protein [unclassified Pseudomonas]KJK18778.1 hypothetical protein UB48_03080 [Pseudomonas sp. 2(2015)]UVL59555.1 Ig-like domain-containing protein [Pseudomonas sp. B21-032]
MSTVKPFSRSNSSLDVSPAEADYDAVIHATLTIRNANGQPVPGVQVEWSERDGKKQIEIENPTNATDANGRATCEVRNGTVPIKPGLGGKGTLQAFIGDEYFHADVSFRDKQ